MKKSKKKANTLTISGKELFQHSSNKLGKHLPVVQSGTGQHKNKKAYSRKNKSKVIHEELNKNPFSSNDLFFFRRPA